MVRKLSSTEAETSCKSLKTATIGLTMGVFNESVFAGQFYLLTNGLKTTRGGDKLL